MNPGETKKRNFAVRDFHADLIVDLLKEEYAEID
jgi:hypothetical protein